MIGIYPICKNCKAAKETTIPHIFKYTICCYCDGKHTFDEITDMVEKKENITYLDVMRAFDGKKVK